MRWLDWPGSGTVQINRPLHKLSVDALPSLGLIRFSALTSNYKNPDSENITFENSYQIF